MRRLYIIIPLLVIIISSCYPSSTNNASIGPSVKCIVGGPIIIKPNSDLCTDIRLKTMFEISVAQFVGGYIGGGGNDKNYFSYKDISSWEKGAETYPYKTSTISQTITMIVLLSENQELINIPYTLSFYTPNGKKLLQKNKGDKEKAIVRPSDYVNKGKNVFHLFEPEVRKNMETVMYSIIFFKKDSTEYYLFLPTLTIFPNDKIIS